MKKEDPQAMPRKKVGLERKKNSEQLRRWWVKISSIFITSHQESFNPFLQVILGGNLQKALVKITKTDRFMKTTGDIGMVFKTDVLDKMTKGESRMFQCELEAELRMSYAQIEQEMMHVELWDFSGCAVNTLKGYVSKPLLEVVRGDVDMMFEIKTKIEKVEVIFATIYMKCIFQEIWDFYITFRDWRASDILPPKKKKIEPKEDKKVNEDEEEDELAEFDEKKEEEDLDDWMLEEPEVKPMLTYQLNSTKAMVYSKTLDSKEPYWPSIDGGIHFRGTVFDLNQQVMSLDLFNYAHGKTSIGRKTVSLNGVLDNNFLKTEVKIDLQSIYSTERHIRYDQTSYLQGIINCGFQPKYKQLGTSFNWHPGYYYLAVRIEKASGLDRLEDITGLELYATVEWGGQVQRTRIMRESVTPVFNETFYFLIPLGDAELTNEEKLIEAVKGEFQSKSRVTLSLWRLFHGGTLMHIGSGSFNLGDLGGLEKEDVTFVTEDRKVIIYESRVLAKSLVLSSAFNADLVSNISFKAWFFNDLPTGLDLNPYKSTTDSFPFEIDNEMRTMSFEPEWRRITSEIYERSDISRDIRKFEIQSQDHCKRQHFLCLFLSSMSPPDQGTIDTTSAPFAHKIRTLGEISHFVRSIPYVSVNQNFWVAPNTTLAIRKGTALDHALLMASLFLGCSYETFDDLKVKFKELFKLASKGKKNEKQANNKASLNYFEEQLEAFIKAEQFKVEQEDEPTKEGTIDEDDDQEEEKESEANKGKPEEKKEDESIPLCNRVFVCMGSDKAKKEVCAWVMTFDKECEHVTFWDPRCHMQYLLKARVKKKELMKEFLKYKVKPDDEFAGEAPPEQKEEASEGIDYGAAGADDNDFDVDERILRETGVKLIMQNDIVNQQDALKSIFIDFNSVYRGGR